MSPYHAIAMLVTIGLLFTATEAVAQDGITSTGRGMVSVKADIGIARLMLKAQAESSADALKKLETNRKHALESLGNLEDKGLTTDLAGVALSIGAAGGPRNPFGEVIVMGQSEEQTDELEVFASQVLTVTLRGAENLVARMGRVLDVAGETKTLPDGPEAPNPYTMWLGLQNQEGGSSHLQEKPPAIRFECSDYEKQARLAMRHAYEEATEEASTLAALTGAKLGNAKEMHHQRSPKWSTTADGTFDIVAEVKVRFSIL
jgi:hypothetical protein